MLQLIIPSPTFPPLERGLGGVSLWGDLLECSAQYCEGYTFFTITGLWDHYLLHSEVHPRSERCETNADILNTQREYSPNGEVMKAVILAIALFLALPLVLSAQEGMWTIYKEYANTALYHGDSFDSLNLIVGAYNAGLNESYILKSSNGGAAWEKVFAEPIPSFVNDIPATYREISYCSDSLIIALAQDSAKLARSTDGGATWKTTYFSDRIRQRGLSMYDDRFGIIGMLGGPNYINYTSDGGLTWRHISLPTTATDTGGIADVACIGPASFVCLLSTKTSKFFCVTSDTGHTWQTTAALPTTHSFFRMFFLNERLGWVIGANRTTQEPSPSAVIWNTTDGGLNWQPQFDSSQSLSFTDIRFSDSLNGLASGGMLVYRTKDGGKNWNREALDTGVGTIDIYIVYSDSHGGVLVTKSGHILRYIQKGSAVAWEQAVKFGVSSPNPVQRDGTTRINIQSNDTRLLNITIVDIQGKVIRTQKDVIVHPGSNDISVNMLGLSSGTYFAQIDSEDEATALIIGY